MVGLCHAAHLFYATLIANVPPANRLHVASKQLLYCERYNVCDTTARTGHEKKKKNGKKKGETYYHICLD